LSKVKVAEKTDLLALHLHFSREMSLARVGLMGLRQDDHARIWACGIRRWASLMAMRRISWIDKRIKNDASVETTAAFF
jgi:hypothetical protein